eukprot:g13347.t1
MQKQLVALTLMWTAQVAPVAAALLAQASSVQEQGGGELDVEDADGILQTGSAFLAGETPDSEPDSEPKIKSLKHVVVVKALASGAELFRMDGSRSPQQKVKVKDIAAHCEEFLSVSPFDKVKIVRDGETQALQPNAKVEPEVGQEEVWLGCYAQQSSLSKLILVAADKLTAPATWSARAKDFAQQLAKSTTSLSDTYTDPFAKEFINAAEWLFDEMALASTPADEDEPVPVRVASGLQSRVRRVENAAFSEWVKKEEEKATLQEDEETKSHSYRVIRDKSHSYIWHSNMANQMFRGCLKKMRELSHEYYKTSKMEMTAPHYRAYESDDAPDSKYVYARHVRRDASSTVESVEYVSRAVHFAPTEVLDALEGQPVPLEARVTLEFNYDAGTQPYTARPGRLRAIIVRGHTSRENLGNEDPGLGKWDAKNLRGSTPSGNWAIVPFATGSEFAPVYTLLPPPVNLMDVGEWVEENGAKFPVLGA